MFNNAKIPEKPLGKPEEMIHKITQKREKIHSQITLLVQTHLHKEEKSSALAPG